MGVRTTCIGAWPKPGYVKLPDWFNVPAGPDTADPTAGWQAAMDALGDEGREIIARGVAEAVHDQIEAGIDIPTDGENRAGELHPLPLPAPARLRFRQPDLARAPGRSLFGEPADHRLAGIGRASVPRR